MPGPAPPTTPASGWWEALGTKMIPGRMQMDWVRYYTLDRPNAKPITATPAHRAHVRRRLLTPAG